MSDYRNTFTVRSGHEVNGLSRTAYKVADEFQVNCTIDRETFKTGWFSKRYEYYITYSGDKDKVSKAILAMRDSAEAYNRKLLSFEVGEADCDSGW